MLRPAVGVASCILLAALADPLAAQATGSITGRVLDSASATVVPTATVTLTPTERRATTDGEGRFVFPALPAGEYRVRVTRAGFRPATRLVTLSASVTERLEIVLVRLAVELAEQRSEAIAVERERFEQSANVGAITISARQLSALPRVAEPDPIRAATLLPGVVGRNDFSSGFSVRGGESSQNLITLDGHPIYNPFHFGGMFSTFIDAAVGDIALHTAGLPARDGGRLSGLLDVQSAEESREGMHGRVDVSMLAAAVSTGGRDAGDSRAWRLSARRTYADQVAELTGATPVPYHFSDLQGQVRLGARDGPRLALTGYSGIDHLDGFYDDVADDDEEAVVRGSTLDVWGNRLLGLTATLPVRSPRAAILGDSAEATLRGSHSMFHSLLDRGDGSSVFRNRLEDQQVEARFERFGRRHRQELGLEVSALDVRWSVEEGQGSIESRDDSERATVVSGYLADRWRPDSALLLDLGVRVERMPVADWTGVSPRFSAKYFRTDDDAFMLAVGRSAQWIHSLALEDAQVRSFEAWRASGPGRPVATAMHAVGGYERWIGRRRFVRVEGFYKWYDDLLEPDLSANPSARTDAFVQVGGRSWGADAIVRQLDGGALTGWIAYTYQVSLRWQDSVRYRPSHDRRHDVNAVLIWRAGDWMLSSRLAYGSPMPYTDLEGFIPRRWWDPTVGRWGGGERRARYEGIGGARNGSVLPATHRVDLSAERRFEFRGASVGLVASLINATNAPNVLLYEYDYTQSPAKKYPVRQLPIIPSMGVTIAW